MKYVVVESFSDMQDGGYTYKPGDIFPRGGVSVSNGRLLELSTDINKLGRALIRKEMEHAKQTATVTGTKSEVVASDSIQAADVVDMVPPQDPSESEKPRRGRRKKN